MFGMRTIATVSATGFEIERQIQDEKGEWRCAGGTYVNSKEAVFSAITRYVRPHERIGHSKNVFASDEYFEATE